MPNERLRDALLRHGLDLDQVARATRVDPKTVERWISKGRLPYPKHRRAIAAMVRETENYLWPDAITPERRAEIGGSEIVQVYPHRHSVPSGRHHVPSRRLLSRSGRTSSQQHRGHCYCFHP